MIAQKAVPEVSNKVPPFFQLVLITISVPLMVYALYRGLSSSRAEDPAPAIITVNPHHVEEFGGYPSTIKVGLFISQFQTFNIIKNDFIFTGILWFQFNPGVISLDTLSKFSFERGKILDISEPDVRLVDNQLVVRYNIRVQFNSSLVYHDFPVDNHRVFIILSHKFISPSEILFTASERNFIITGDVTGWKLIDRHVKAGFQQDEIDEYDKRITISFPRVVFELDYSITGVRNVMTIFLPLLLLFYLLSFAFSVGANEGMKLAVGGITAILAYRFVIENISPPTGYFMLSDALFFLFLTASFSVFFLTTIDLVAFRISTVHKKIALLIIFTAVNSTVLYLFWN